ncbi:ABC transporter ATP-binding protein [Bradyrhizobium canariense]|uniref:Amino acid/amide ABC transporter ATP-binding protein 1, HAAT family n=1 Tax=Bradyrhizobium canariense TaxID=255045 RepID=A0A1H2ALF6_9BRAD|nr:ABC transporter ATP-binding protein [Bradyrhizobium canariense]SDT46366.1 amino acid/amide ABC transporter ATP-binding protein 1, HAAT family [Bradyrhizobium canariense]
MSSTDTPVLQTRNLTRRFGGYSAVSNVDLTIRRGTIHALIGPNGAGKTTLFNLMTGVLPPTEGQIIIDGVDVSGSRPDSIARRGVVRTFQGVRLFPSMTALENVEVGRFSRTRGGFLTALARVPGLATPTEAATRRRAEELLERVGLSARRNVLATELALADQRRLEIARALAVDPKLLLLDEPVAGMNPVEVQEAARLFKSLLDDGITILITEHHMSLVMAISDVISVMNYGRKIAEGPPEAVKRDPEVLAAYLGTEAAA